MQVKTALEWICKIGEILEKYQASRIKEENDRIYDLFGRYCELKVADAENQGVVIDPVHKPQFADEVFYIVGKDKNGAEYSYKCSFEAFKKSYLEHNKNKSLPHDEVFSRFLWWVIGSVVVSALYLILLAW